MRRKKYYSFWEESESDGEEDDYGIEYRFRSASESSGQYCISLCQISLTWLNSFLLAYR